MKTQGRQVDYLMREKIREFIIKNFITSGKELRDDELLFDSGIIDSMGLLNLLSFIEKELGVSIKPTEITIDNFGSVDKITKLVNGKTKDKKLNKS